MRCCTCARSSPHMNIYLCAYIIIIITASHHDMMLVRFVEHTNTHIHTAHNGSVPKNREECYKSANTHYSTHTRTHKKTHAPQRRIIRKNHMNYYLHAGLFVCVRARISANSFGGLYYGSIVSEFIYLFLFLLVLVHHHSINTFVRVWMCFNRIQLLCARHHRITGSVCVCMCVSSRAL